MGPDGTRRPAGQNSDNSSYANDHAGNLATGMTDGLVRAGGKIKMSGWSKSAEPVNVAPQ